MFDGIVFSDSIGGAKERFKLFTKRSDRYCNFESGLLGRWKLDRYGCRTRAHNLMKIFERREAETSTAEKSQEKR